MESEEAIDYVASVLFSNTPEKSNNKRSNSEVSDHSDLSPASTEPARKMANIEGINLEGDTKAILTQFLTVYKQDMSTINERISTIQSSICTKSILKEELKKNKTTILSEVTKVCESVNEITTKFNV